MCVISCSVPTYICNVYVSFLVFIRVVKTHFTVFDKDVEGAVWGLLLPCLLLPFFAQQIHAGGALVQEKAYCGHQLSHSSKIPFISYIHQIT